MEKPVIELSEEHIGHMVVDMADYLEGAFDAPTETALLVARHMFDTIVELALTYGQYPRDRRILPGWQTP